MGILDSKYNAELYFSDLVEVVAHNWNPAFFELQKLSPMQLESHMVNGTFEGVWPEVLTAFHEGAHKDHIANIMYRAISPYLKQDVDIKQPTNIYMTTLTEIGPRCGDEVYSFSIWECCRRESVFEVKFSGKFL